MVSEVKTSTARISDLIKWETNPKYCRDDVVFNNDTGAQLVIDDPMGYPVAISGGVAVPLVDGEEATVDGLLIWDKKIDLANGDDLNLGLGVPVIVRGPNLVNEDAIPVNDYAGNPFSLAALKLALEALLFVFMEESTPEEVQTT